MFLYAVAIGWPAGFQKIGVSTTGPVEGVPITVPPWKSSGGVPIAASPAAWTAQLCFAASGREIPPKCATRAGPPTCAGHGNWADEDRCVPAAAGPPPAVKV